MQEYLWLIIKYPDLDESDSTEMLKEPQIISIHWFYLLQNRVDTSTKSKQFVTYTSVCP